MPGGSPPSLSGRGRKDRQSESVIVGTVKTLRIEVDDEVMDQLERVGLSRSQQRFEFIAAAIRKALWELEERQTAEAYARQPDSAEDVYVDPLAWEA